MKLFILLCVLFTSATSFAQERCAALLIAKANTLRQDAASPALANGEKPVPEEGVIHIPVVVHVLYHNTQQSISDAQIKSGLQALNRDFRRRNADTVNTPEPFRRLAADVQIEFFLARSGPQGQPTTGIERRASMREVWLADDRMKYASQGGLDAWDSRSYLNIWICNLAGGSGYASAPGGDADTDGLVIHYNAFAPSNTPSPFNMGRTAVHEAGHWLGLKHIWGDQPCGDDGIDDTPQQGFFTKGCPTTLRSSCNNSGAGDMFMNYMDYTDDACMNLFTAGQRQRMRSAFYQGGSRASLLSSRGLEEPWISELPPPAPTAALYPNPASHSITLQTDGGQIGKTFTLVNNQGQLIRTERITAPSQTIEIQTLKPGVYFLKGAGFQHKFVKL